MRRIRLLLSLICTAFLLDSSIAQVNLQWANTYSPGGPGSSSQGYFNGMAVDHDGNVCVAGETYNSNGTGNTSLSIAKYTTTGTTLWSSNYSFPGTTYQYVRGGVGVDAANNIYVTGYVYDYNSNSSANDYNHMYVIKYDPSGNMLWSKIYDSGQSDYMNFSGIVVDPNGGVAVAGTHQNYNAANSNYSDILVVKYDGNGNLLYATTVDNGTYENLLMIAGDGTGGLYISFQTYNNGNGNNSIGVAKLDANGTKLWSSIHNPLNGSNYVYSYGNCLAVDPSGNAILTGYQFNYGGTSSYSSITLKFDQNGNELWANNYKSGLYNYYGSVATDVNGNIYMVSNVYSSNNTYHWDLVKYDPSGNQIWASSVFNTGAGNGQYSWNEDIAVDNSGNAFLAGYGYNYFNNNNYYSAQTAKVNADGSKGWEVAYPTSLPANSTYNYSVGYDVDVDNNGGVYVLGLQQVNDNTNAYTSSILTLKYSQSAGALNFDGMNDFVAMNTTASVTNLGSGLTMEAWINPNDVTNVNSIIRKTGDYNLYVYGGVLYAEVWTVSGGSNWKKIAGSTPIATNAWTHVAAEWDGTNCILYVNGIVDPSTSSAGGGYASEGLSLGMSSVYGQPFSGTMDEVRIWSRPLCQLEVQNSMSCELASGQTGLAAYYKFNEGVVNVDNSTVTTLTDISGNGNDGILNNFALIGTTSNWVTGYVNGTCSAFTPPVTPIAVSGPTTFCSPGSVTLTASGGTSYSWSTGETTSSITVSNSGTYSVTSPTTGGCPASGSIGVISNPTPTASLTATTNVSCNQGNNGSAIVAAAGGTGTYTYNWTPSGGTASAANNLSAGTYTCTITDANSCGPIVLTATITQPDPLVAAITSQTNVVCPGDQSGSATSSLTGGTPPYAFMWSTSPHQNTANAGNLGAGTYTLVVSDLLGCTASASVTINQVDNIAPTAVCKNLTVYLDPTGNARLTPTQADGGSFDNCGIANMTVVPASWTGANLGTNTVYLTVTDASGNQSTCQTTVTLLDTTAPVVTCPASLILNCGQPTDVSNTGIATATDNYMVASITSSDVTTAGNCASNYFITRTWVAKDVSGNSASCVQTITVQDNLAPVITCDAYVTLNCGTDITPQTVCPGSSQGGGTPVGPGKGKKVKNTTNPKTYSNKSNSRQSGSPVSACALTATVADNCDPNPTLAYTDAITPGLCAGNYTITRTWTAKDMCGNVSLAIQTITIQDTVAPVITSAPDIAIGNDKGQCGAAVNFQVNATDQCSNVNLTYSVASGSFFPVGTTPVTVTAADGCGNTSSSNFNVTITDREAPVVITRNVTAQLDAFGNASVTAVQVNNGSTDNCGIASMTVAPNTFNCTKVGPNTVVLTVTDLNGNVSTGNSTVTVQDNIAPIAKAQNVIIQLGATGNASVTAAQVNNGSSDNCSVKTLSVSPAAFTCANVGTNNVTLTVTDVNGNSSIAAATVTVQDKIAPVAKAQNVTVQLNASGNASVTAAQVNNGSSDNCSVKTLAVSPNTFTCSNVGANTVTLTVTDASGNTSTATATVTVQDNVAPVAICQNVTVYLDSRGTATITAAQVNHGSTDNCGIASVKVSPSTFTCANTGNNQVTLTVTDIHGNSSTCTSTVTVVDNTPPTVLCKNTTVTISHGKASIAVTDVNNGSTDNCGIASMTVSPNTFTCADIGTKTVTLTVTDVHGNSATCQSTVTIKGVAPACVVSSRICGDSDDGDGDGHGDGHGDGDGEGDGKTHKDGGDDNNNTPANITQLYLGYGPQSLCLSTTASGGAAFTYSWSGTGLSNTQISNPVFTPTTQGNYTLAVTTTNEYGCTSTCSIVICVLDIRVPKRNGMVYVCHAGNDKDDHPVTYIMSAEQAKDLLEEHPGDHLGRCTQTCGNMNGKESGAENIEEFDAQFNVTAFPNPFMENFHVRLETVSTEDITIRLFSISGSLMLSLDHVKADQEVDLGNDLATGMYFLEVQQGSNKKVLKVKKMK